MTNGIEADSGGLLKISAFPIPVARVSALKAGGGEPRPLNLKDTVSASVINMVLAVSPCT